MLYYYTTNSPYGQDGKPPFLYEFLVIFAIWNNWQLF